MTSRDFCYWLQGFFEISGDIQLSEEQGEIIQNHLAMVFKHEIDPSMGDLKHQNDLGVIHNQADHGSVSSVTSYPVDTFKC